MKVNDFTFADKTLADFNCICCNFDNNSGMVEVGVELETKSRKIIWIGLVQFILYDI